MFCNNCGTENREGSVFCVNCGAPMASGAPIAEMPHENLQYDYTNYQPEAPKKKNLLPWIIGGVALVGVIVLVICLICGGGHGFEDPKEVAVAWVESMYDLDSGAMLEAVYPEMADEIEDDIDDEIAEMEEEAEDENIDFEVKKIKAKKIDKVSDEMVELYTLWFNDEYDTDIEISEMRRYRVTTDLVINGEDEETKTKITVVEIDGKWYVWPLDYIDVDIDDYYDYVDDYDYDDYDYDDGY